MDHLGLGPHEFGAYLRTLTTPGHERRIRLDVLDLDTGQHRSSLTTKVMEGQVVYDTTAGHTTPTRMADMRFADEGNRLGFEPDDASDAPIHRSRLIRVFDCRYVDESSIGWVDCPVFTGPLWDFSRVGVDVSVTAKGMELQALGQVWDTFHFPRKSKLTHAIRTLLNAAGDVNAVVPDLPHTFPKDVTVHPMDSVWPRVLRIARSLNRYAFYDGMGRFQMRTHHFRPVYRFHESLTDRVTTKRTVDGFVNTVVVLGPKPHGSKKRIRGEATLKGPLSPASLSRHGVPFRAVLQEEHDHLKTKKHADAIAARLLHEHATLRTDLEFPAVPVPMLEEYDPVSVTDPAFGTERLRMHQWNLPLEAGDPGGSEGTSMTVGYARRTTRARVRR